EDRSAPGCDPRSARGVELPQRAGPARRAVAPSPRAGADRARAARPPRRSAGAAAEPTRSDKRAGPARPHPAAPAGGRRTQRGRPPRSRRADRPGKEHAMTAPDPSGVSARSRVPAATFDGQTMRRLELGRTRLLVTGALFVVAFLVVSARLVSLMALQL